MTDWLQLLGGGLLLYFGAGWLVGGASALARALRVPEILVGLTVVAYGTSAPEVIVGVQAAATGHGGVALGNVIGSNVANVGLILGIAALIRPARVDAAMRRRELPVLLLSAALLPVLLWDGTIGRLEAGGLVLAALGYTAWMIRDAHAASAAAFRPEIELANQDTDAAVARGPRGIVRSLVTATLGLVVLLVGGHLLVEGAVSVAHALGMSERVVGLTIVAVGTSVPELVTSAVAAARGHSDLAIGNVVGSNIFNVSLCLGAAGIAGAIAAPLRTLDVELVFLAVMTVLAAAFIRGDRVVSRAHGGIAVGLYATFIVLMVLRG
ncbi:MAG: calcium/sodium antiporter [Polyangiaceae bacterium]|nr:calcium/sodium antiporter [Polyangiaceae bacterium]